MATMTSGLGLSRLSVPSIAATSVLLAAGLAPVAVATQLNTRGLASVTADIALSSAAVVDNFDTLAGLAAFDVAAAAEEIDLSAIGELPEIPWIGETFDLPGAEAFDLPGSAAAFDIVGLFNAEVAAAVGLFNHVISLPFTIFYGIEDVIGSLLNLDFGMAFSEAISIPLDIVNYVISLPGAVVNTAFQMLLVLPGEYLFNFG